MDCRRGQGLWMQTWVWHKPSWRRSPLTHQRAARTYTGLGNRLLVGTNRTLCTRTQEKGAVSPQETDPDLTVSVQESPWEAWVGGGLLQGLGALSIAVHAWDLLKHIAIIFITSTIVWPQVNNRE